MARSQTKTTKSETLTIRLDLKTRFVLEYVSRLKGQSITTVVERAILTAASQETVPDLSSFGPNDALTWHDFWDVSEGVRALSLSSRTEFFPTYEEDRKLSFCKEHWPFFFANSKRRAFLNHYVDVLWPRIDEFIQMHEDQKSKDYFAAGHAMQKALSDAKLKAPEWPIVEKPEPPKPNKSRDLDDEIPF
ncbi:hypothetical protein J1C56_09145 [Aminobacter anthyllidis]|uniref:Uncharacterized protein n=1 Tax=Aminobacter anthyllidis TaxID=1035067 RepID=A0A9X1A9K8_9HYPH|nr:hypothetical protein [Aminobacter anthyllidis]MBT1155757.1 hypothetical protein [Aminobacter anthyllidis]